ncbi:MAG: cation transporter [Chitinophagales bacterium]
MKKIILTLNVLFFFFTVNTFAKEVTTKASFIVSGNCDMCKERIEKAAKTAGVKSAVWNEDTHVLTVSFVPNKVSVDQVEQSIAKAGYDTPKFKATEEDYNKLPKCCQYER